MTMSFAQLESKLRSTCFRTPNGGCLPFGHFNLRAGFRFVVFGGVGLLQYSARQGTRP
jgi:hypothetical protein